MAYPSASPRKRLAVVACMDARLDPHTILGLEPGDAHVVRNAGGIVTDDVLRSLAASQRLLGTTEIVIVMHEDCGLHGADEEEVMGRLAADGVYPKWDLGAFDDLDATLRGSIALLRSSRELVARDNIRGLVFDPATGAVREVAADD